MLRVYRMSIGQQSLCNIYRVFTEKKLLYNMYKVVMRQKSSRVYAGYLYYKKKIIVSEYRVNKYYYTMYTSYLWDKNHHKGIQCVSNKKIIIIVYTISVYIIKVFSVYMSKAVGRIRH